MRLSFMFATMAILTLSACAYTPPVTMDAAHSNALRDKTFSVVTHNHIDTRIQTMGQTMAWGTLASFHFVSEGERIMKQDKIPDPALATTAQVASQLATRHGMKQVGTPDKIYGGPEPMAGVEAEVSDLFAVYPDGDYLLDIDSGFWWMMYNTFDGYHVIYRSYNRLIERSTGTVIVARPCVFDSNNDEDDHPSYDEYLANNSELLKKALNKAAGKCATEFLEQLSATPKL